MAQAIEYPLDPTDAVLLATHETMRARGYCGLNIMLIADVEGPLETASVAAAAQRVGECYPALSARIRQSAVLGRALWRIAPGANLGSAIEFETSPARDADVEAPFRAALADAIDPSHGPQVKLIHVQIDERRHRLALRWPHYLMDTEGASCLLHELDCALRGAPPVLGRDPRAVPAAPFRARWPRSMLRAWQSRARFVRFCFERQPRMVPKPDMESRLPNYRVRNLPAEFRQRMQEAARRRATPGPMLYTRWMLGAMARTYYDICTQRGRPREAYLFSSVMSLPREGPRPGVHGTHVTVPWLRFRPRELISAAAADAVITRQLLRDHAARGAEADWCNARAIRWWPFPVVKRLMRHRLPPGAGCMSAYRFGEAITTLGDARITNLVNLGTAPGHPGWILLYNTYGVEMSIALTFFEDFLDRASVDEFLDRLESRLVESVETT